MRESFVATSTTTSTICVAGQRDLIRIFVACVHSGLDTDQIAAVREATAESVTISGFWLDEIKSAATWAYQWPEHKHSMMQLGYELAAILSGQRDSLPIYADCARD